MMQQLFYFHMHLLSSLTNKILLFCSSNSRSRLPDESGTVRSLPGWYVETSCVVWIWIRSPILVEIKNTFSIWCRAIFSDFMILLVSNFCHPDNPHTGTNQQLNGCHDSHICSSSCAKSHAPLFFFFVFYHVGNWWVKSVLVIIVCIVHLMKNVNLWSSLT